MTYSWTAPSGISLSSNTAASPTFTAPDRTGDYTLTFSLVVNDGNSDSAADTVAIKVTADDDPPTASAGPDQSVNAGDTVTLAGKGSRPRRPGPDLRLDRALRHHVEQRHRRRAHLHRAGPG